MSRLTRWLVPVVARGLVGEPSTLAGVCGVALVMQEALVDP